LARQAGWQVLSPWTPVRPSLPVGLPPKLQHQTKSSSTSTSPLGKSPQELARVIEQMMDARDRKKAATGRSRLTDKD
jgi:hypothetical protein